MGPGKVTHSYSVDRAGRILPLAVAALLLAFLVVLPGQADAATIAVNTTVDELNADGDCSLREAIQAANTNAAVDACAAGDLAPTVDVVNFSVIGTITLTSGQLTVTDDLHIDGPGAANLTISGNNSTRVMEVSTGTTLDLESVTVADGYRATPPVAATGAGILNTGTLTVTNATFSANSAAAGSNPGGAIANSGGTVTVSDSTFSGNGAGGFGGGINNSEGGTLTVSNSSFSANGSGEGGGGIANSGGGTVTVTDTTFSANSAAFGGGGISTSEATLTVTNTTFSDNSASAAGGGISNYSSTVSVTNSTFSGNSGFYFGGGIYNSGGAASLTTTNTTFSGNSAGGGGGVHAEPDAALTLQNTIVANSPSGGNCSGPINDGGGNLQYPGTDCGGTITSADPLLDPAGLQDNGGPTQTINLQSGSPAINNAVQANCPPTDQRGELRPQGGACDIGAVELVIGYPRPKGATPLRVSLVPAYLACSSSNRTHGPPLAYASCAPPAKLSQYATVGTPDANGRPAGSVGSVLMVVAAGNPSTPADEADVSLGTSVTDVRAPGDLSDYTGELLVAVGMRIIDKHNGPSLSEPATVVDTALSWPVQCAPTADPNIGATCASSTTADALVPGTVNEGKRTTWALKQIHVADGGEDGQAVTAGDNTPFMKQGVFVP